MPEGLHDPRTNIKNTLDQNAVHNKFARGEDTKSNHNEGAEPDFLAYLVQTWTAENAHIHFALPLATSARMLDDWRQL